MPLLTKLFTTEMIRTDDLAIDRSAAAEKTAWCGRPMRFARSWNPATVKTRTGIMWKAVSAAVCIPAGAGAD